MLRDSARSFAGRDWSKTTTRLDNLSFKALANNSWLCEIRIHLVMLYIAALKSFMILGLPFTKEMPCAAHGSIQNNKLPWRSSLSKCPQNHRQHARLDAARSRTVEHINQSCFSQASAAASMLRKSTGSDRITASNKKSVSVPSSLRGFTLQAVS